MPSFWWLVLILYILTNHIHLASPQSITFGFTKHTHKNSGHDAPVTLTLYWNTTIYECTIPTDPKDGNSSFTCNSTMTIGANDKEEYKMKLFYNHPWIFRPSSIYVIDSGNTYTIDTFCGPIQYHYFDYVYNTPQNESLCTGYFAGLNRYNYSYLELATNSVYLSTLYISFIDDILSYPNMALPGSVSPAKVTNFTVTTAPGANSGNSINFITLRLYWDIELFVCTILLKDASTSYTCDVSDIFHVQSNCTDALYPSSSTSLFTLFVQNDDNIGIAIDSISVTDESGYNYEIDTFCQGNLSQYGEGQIGINDTMLSSTCQDFDGDLSEYGNICIDSTQNQFGDCLENNEIVAIEFNKNLFWTKKSNKEGFIYPVNSLNPLNCNITTPSRNIGNVTTTVYPINTETTTQALTTGVINNGTLKTPTRWKPQPPKNSNADDYEGDDDEEADQKDIIIIILSVSLGVLVLLIICGSVFYYVYQKGIKKGIQTFTGDQIEMGVNEKEQKKGEQSNLNVLDDNDETAPVAFSSDISASISIEDQQKAIHQKQDEGNNDTGYEKKNGGLLNKKEDVHNNEQKDDMNSVNPIDNEVANVNDNTLSVSEVDALEMKKKVLEKVDSLDDLYEPTEDNTPGNVEKDEEEATDKH